MPKMCVLSHPVERHRQQVEWAQRQQQPQNHANYHYLSDSEKNGRMRELHHSNSVAQRRIIHFRKHKERTDLG